MDNRLWTAVILGISLIPAETQAKGKGGGGSVHVRGYTRKDGTYVAPHTRHAPGTGSKGGGDFIVPYIPLPRTEPRTAPRTSARTLPRSNFGGSTNFPAEQVGSSADSNDETIVYVTVIGGDYHRAGCQHLEGGRMPISLSQAVARFRACPDCRPPTSSEDSIKGRNTPENATAQAGSHFKGGSPDDVRAELERERSARERAEQEAASLKIELERTRDAKAKAEREKLEREAAERQRQETAAQGKLLQAKTFLAQGNIDAGKRWLREIIEKYPSTRAAEEARGLLKR